MPVGRALCAGVVGVLAGLGAVGCDSLDVTESKSRAVSLADFSMPSTSSRAAPRAYYVDTAGPELSAGSVTGDRSAALIDDDAELLAGDDSLGAVPGAVSAAGGRAASVPTGPDRAAQALGADELEAEEDRRWMIDGLVGQINGRPVFADDFMLTLEPKLLEFAALSDRAVGRQAMVELIRDRFQNWVNSELIISEAENQLSPEQQQGLFAWLRSIQETEIASRGGTLAEAQQSLEEDLGMQIEEFLQVRRDMGLARYLIDRKVKPRTIVSWRDIEREYGRRAAEFNPPAKVAIGRVFADEKAEPERAARVKTMVEAGQSFEAIAAELELANGGVLAEVVVEPGQSVDEAIVASDLADSLKAALRGVEVGSITGPIKVRDALAWFALLGVSQGVARDIYDPDVQLQIKAELNVRRGDVEQRRYLAQLRSRRISADIDRIEERLMIMALRRYWLSG